MKHNPVKSSPESRVQRLIDRAGIDKVAETAGYSDKPVAVDALGGTATHPGTKQIIATLTTELLAAARESDGFHAFRMGGPETSRMRFSLERAGEMIGVGLFENATGANAGRTLHFNKPGRHLGFEAHPNAEVRTSETDSSEGVYFRRTEKLKPDGRVEGKVVHDWNEALETNYYTRYPSKKD